MKAFITKINNINARELAEYVQTLDYLEYKTFLNTTYCLISCSTFRKLINYERLNLRHKMYRLAMKMILEGEY